MHLGGLESADDIDMSGADGGGPEEPIHRREHCRACGGSMTRIPTTYCYSNLLVRELATLGIKVVHKMEPESEDK